MNTNFFKVRVFHTLKMFSGLKLIPVLLTKKKKFGLGIKLKCELRFLPLMFPGLGIYPSGLTDFILNT